MARNRLVLVVPCHRVIGSDGDLHGYGAGGLEMKARLLAWEQANAGRD
jgi:O-6-methylguanine DNA methyltransferase